MLLESLAGKGGGGWGVGGVVVGGSAASTCEGTLGRTFSEQDARRPIQAKCGFAGNRHKYQRKEKKEVSKIFTAVME